MNTSINTSRATQGTKIRVPVKQKTAEPIRLVAFDLDGTIFANPVTREYTPHVDRCFQTLHDAGVYLCLATGRPYSMLGDAILAAPWLDYAITSGGARIHAINQSELPVSTDNTHVFSPELAEALISVIHDLGGSVSVHTQRASFVERQRAIQFARSHREAFWQHLSSEEIEIFNEELDNPSKDSPLELFMSAGLMQTIDDAIVYMQSHPNLEVEKIDCDVLTPAAACELLRRMEALKPQLGGLFFSRINDSEFEITVEAASKGTALAWLLNYLELDSENSVAFGDSGNDVSFVGAAGRFIAMGNARENVKGVADDICESVERDGVAVWLKDALPHVFEDTQQG